MLFSVLLYYLLKGLAYIPCWLNQRSAERSGKVKPNNHIGASAKIEATRPEGAEAHSPGHPPWVKVPKQTRRPVRAKALFINAFALAGRLAFINPYTQGGCPGLCAYWAFSPSLTTLLVLPDSNICLYFFLFFLFIHTFLLPLRCNIQ